MNKQVVIIRVEPSKRLSELCGFPYFIERRFATKKLLKQGVIDESDVAKMSLGKEICKPLKVRNA